MAEPTLQQVFGANATQTDTTITITKADLIATGYIPSANNSAESSLMALVLVASPTLTATNRTNNPEQNLAIDRGLDRTSYRGQVAYNEASFTVSAQKLAPNTPLNPADY